MRGSGEENNNGSGCGDKNRMRAVDGKQEIYPNAWAGSKAAVLCTFIFKHLQAVAVCGEFYKALSPF